MRVSVVMVNFNYGRYLNHALESVIRQTYAVDEIIVVDDGSTDESKGVLSRMASRVTVLWQENRGVAVATNRGIAAATGEIVALLDADDLMVDSRIEQLVAAYTDFPAVDWVWHESRHIYRESLAPLLADVPQTEGKVGLVDVRNLARRGVTRLGVIAPATSGLSFRRAFVEQLLPMPELVRSQDGYLKFASLALGRGLVLSTPLSLQGIHEANMFTGALAAADRRRFYAENFIAMASGWKKVPALVNLANRYLGDALVLSRLGLGVRPQYRHLLRQQLCSSKFPAHFRIVRAAAVQCATDARGAISGWWRR